MEVERKTKLKGILYILKHLYMAKAPMGTVAYLFAVSPNRCVAIKSRAGVFCHIFGEAQHDQQKNKLK